MGDLRLSPEQQQTIEDMNKAFAKISEAMGALANAFRAYLVPAVKQFYPIIVKMKRATLYSYLSTWLPDWLAEPIADHCPERWLPDIDFKEYRRD